MAALAVPVLAAPATAAPVGSTLLVSRPDGNGPPPPASDGSSSTPAAISDDGRYAVFTSVSPAAPGADEHGGLFVRDLSAGTTTLVSRADGANGAPANALGRQAAVAVAPASAVSDAPHDRPHVLVAFSTAATNLVDHKTPATTTTGLEEVWLRDVTAGTTYLVSRSSSIPDGPPANAAAEQPSITVSDANGPIVAFRSSASNLVAGTTFGTPNIFLRTLRAGGTLLVSCQNRDCSAHVGTTSGADHPSVRFEPPSGPSSVCPTGFGCVVVAFATGDTTITGEPGTAHEQIVVAGAADSTLTFSEFIAASRPDGSGTTFGSGNSFAPSLSPDAQLVGFISAATNLGVAPPTGLNAAYVRRLDGIPKTALVSASDSGQPANGQVTDVALGGDSTHRRAVFTADATNLGFPDQFGDPRAWARQLSASDLSVGTTELLDRPAGNGTTPGDGGSAQAGISADGTSALFFSDSRNLNTIAGIDYQRLYVRHLDTESLDVASRPDGTGPFANGVASSHVNRQAVSADGRYVAFESNSDNLASGENNLVTGVFVRDTSSRTTTLVSRANGPSGAAANADSTLGGISDDGRRVLFSSAADNLGAAPTGGADRAYVRDLAAGTTIFASRANGASGTLATGTGMAISGDGNSVAFASAAPLDPDESPGIPHLFVRNFAAGATTFVDRDNGPSGASAFADATDAVLNRDGTRVAWTTRASLLGLPFGATLSKVYERDLRAATTTLISRAEGQAGALANQAATNPSIDATGNVVAFQSAATNLGTPVGDQAIWVRDVSRSHTSLASRAPGAAGAPADGAATNPSLDAAGDRVAFRSNASNLGAGPAPSTFDLQAYVRDLPSGATELVSRANGIAGAPFDAPGPGHVSLSASGDCAAFDATGLNAGDGFASSRIAAVHLRVLRGECPGAGAPGGPPPGGGKPTPVPTLSGLRVVPSRFAVAPRRTPKHRRHRSRTHFGSSIRFRLSTAARVNFVIARQTTGRKAGHRCHAAHGSVPRRRRCTLFVKAGSLSARLTAGSKRVAFSGRLGRRALALGRYRLTATPVDPKHRRVHSVTASFMIVRAR